YIQSVFYEVRLFAVIHVSNQKSSSLTKFSGKMSGSASLSVLQASASLGGDTSVSTAHQAGALDIEIHTEGIDLRPSIEAIGIAQADGLADIAARLSKYLQDKPKGQPVKYKLAPLPGMRTDSLSDQRIFSLLNGMKSNFIATSYR